MNVEYINPFLEASKSIISQTTGLTPILGKVKIKNVPYNSDNVIVLIGLTGKIKGTAVISMSREMACKIASLMMGGMPVPSLDEISKSAIAELFNMILGTTATIFSQRNMNIDITAPTVLIGDNLELSVHKSVVVSIPILFENDGKIDLDISYTDQK